MTQHTPKQTPATGTKRGLRKAFHEINRIHGSVYLFISFAALILSQFPPIYEWFYDSKLNVSIQNRLSLSPDLRHGFSLSKIYTVTNRGEKMGEINSINLIIAKNGNNTIQNLKVCKYMRELGPFGQPIMADFSPIPLKPEDNWSHRVSFSGSVSVYDVDNVGEILQQIADEEADWRQNQKEGGKTQEEIDSMNFQVPEDLQEQLKEYLKDKLDWLSEGYYTVYEISMTNEGPIVVSYGLEIEKYHVYRFGQIVDNFIHYLEYDGINFGNNMTLDFELKTVSVGIPASLENELNKYPEAQYGLAGETRC